MMMMMMINDDGDEKWSLGGAKLRLLFLFQLLDILLPLKGETKQFFLRCTRTLKLQSEVWRFIRKRVGVHARHAAL
jgi:hypothetical protein